MTTNPPERSGTGGTAHMPARSGTGGTAHMPARSGTGGTTHMPARSGTSGTARLADRYRRLIAVYPTEYRRLRGEELIGTLLDAAAPGQRFPSPADVVDLTRGALRVRARGRYRPALRDGAAWASPVAMALAAGLAVFFWIAIEPHGTPMVGSAPTLGPWCYVAWVLALAGWVTETRYVTRWLLATAAAVTLLMLLPIGAVHPGAPHRPPLWTVLALILLGTLAGLGTPREPSRRIRAGTAVGAMLVTGAATLLYRVEPGYGSGYYGSVVTVAGTVVAITVALAFGAAALRARSRRRQDARSAIWAALLLALPGGVLGPLGWQPPARMPEWVTPAGLPHFGRLAEVVLSACVIVGAMAWLAAGEPATGARQPAARQPAAGKRRPECGDPLRRAGAIAGGSAVGLGICATLSATAVRTDIAVTVTLLVLVALGAGRPARYARWAGATAACWVVVAVPVTSYASGWAGVPARVSPLALTLVTTLALVPFTLAIYGAARVFAAAATGADADGPDVGTLVRATVVLGAAGSWVGLATLPHLADWGPVLLLLAIVATAAAGRGIHRIIGRRRVASHLATGDARSQPSPR